MTALLVVLCIWLERSCCLMHWCPRWGCRAARWSHRLDERFGLGMWKEPTETRDFGARVNVRWDCLE